MSAHHEHDHAHDTDGDQDLAAHWEERYAGDRPIWSGRVNATLADVVCAFEPGRALDLGCGEGGDATWLAQRGWQVVGVDVSATAVERARAAAAAAAVGDQVQFVVTDLSAWSPEGEFDLVTASFFHSQVEFPRTEVLRRAAGALRSGGHLVVVSHAAFPPWSDAAAHGEHRFLTPDEERAELGLEPAEWVVELAEVRPRDAVGPDGQQAVLDDGVLVLRRR